MPSPRPRAVLAAGAVLVTGAALAAAPFQTADAAHAAHHVSSRDTAAPTITITTSKTGTTLSATTITPGNTLFNVVGVGAVDLITFKPGYTLADLAKDAKKLFKGDVKTVRRVDKKVTFWGGVNASAAGSQMGMDLPAGSYYVINLDKNTVGNLTVSGTPEARTLPATSGKIGMVHDMTFKVSKTQPKAGWIETANKATEPHFVEMQKVKKGTSKNTIAQFLAHGAQGRPSWALKESHGTLPISPGHSFQWYLDASKGEYVTLCFWPSKKTGMPHALMGMFDITNVK